MKTFKHILPFLLALLVLAGCEDDVNYTQGTAENPDCYGVYFPKKQATRTDLEFEPGKLFLYYHISFLFFISIPLCRRLYLAGKRYGKRTAFAYGGYHLDSPVHVFHDGLADG